MKKFASALVALGFGATICVVAQDAPRSGDTTSTSPADSSKTKTHRKVNDSSDSSRNRITDSTAVMVGEKDRAFMNKAAAGGLSEVQLGQLAQQKASGQAAKDFGKKMEQDHSKANQELTELAKTKGVSLPSEPSTEDKALYDHLNNLTGPQFDKAYIRAMVKDHRKDVTEFEKASSNSMDSDLKAWAAKTLPTLREHLTMAQQAETSSPASKMDKMKMDKTSTEPSKTPPQPI